MEKTEIFIYGAGGHGRVVADIAKRRGFKKIYFIDDNKKEFLSFEDIKNKPTLIALGIGDNFIRKKIFFKLKKYNFSIVTLVDPTAIIGSNVKIGEGSVIMPNVIVNANSVIKEGVILNSGSIIEHDNIIKEFVHIAPGVITGGGVEIGKSSFIGLGSKIINNVKIGNNVFIGAGSVVVKDVESDSFGYGVPFKRK